MYISISFKTILKPVPLKSKYLIIGHEHNIAHYTAIRVLRRNDFFNSIFE